MLRAKRNFLFSSIPFYTEEIEVQRSWLAQDDTVNQWQRPRVLYFSFWFHQISYCCIFFSCNMYVSAHVYRHTQIKWPLSGPSHIPNVYPGLHAVLNTASSHSLSAGKIYGMKINQWHHYKDYFQRANIYANRYICMYIFHVTFFKSFPDLGPKTLIDSSY